MFNVISVQFINSMSLIGDAAKEYSYLTDLTDLTIGSIVVVDTQNGYQLAKVSSLFGNEQAANKWIVCSVDIGAFERKLQELKRKQFIIKQIKQHIERKSFLSQAEALAKDDPVLSKLLVGLGDTNQVPLALSKSDDGSENSALD